jgi:diguanylate cyclase (GGDEF)-like protein
MALLISSAVHSNDSIRFIFKNLTLEDGLPSLEISSIFQQSTGFIWFATGRGASRYDGYEFRNYSYNPGNDTHISNNFVIDIAEDSKGNIWLATEDGLNKISPDGSTAIYNVKDGMPSGWILSMFIDPQDRIWLSTGNGVVYFDLDKKLFSAIKVLSNYSSSDILQLPGGEIIASFGSKLHILNSKEEVAPEIFSTQLAQFLTTEDLITYMAIVDEQRLLVGTEKSGIIDIDLQSTDARQLTIKDGLGSDSISDILEVSSSHYLAAHYAFGLSLVDKKTQQVNTITHTDFDPYSLPSDSIRSVLLDSAKNLWVATDNGVAKTRLNSPFEFYQVRADQTGLSGREINRVVASEPGTIMSLSNNVLDSINLVSREVVSNILDMEKYSREADEKIWSVTQQDDDIWFVSNKGLLKYQASTETFVRYQNSANNPYNLPTSEYYTVLPEPSGGVWITGYYNVGLTLFTEEEGVARQFMTRAEDIYQAEGNYTQEKILASDGHIWMATTDGVFRVNPESGVYQHIRFGETAYIRASDIVEDDQNNFWVTTEGAGLVKITGPEKDGEFELVYYTTAHGLPDDNLVSLVSDGPHLWVFTNQKLAKFDPIKEQVTVLNGLFDIPNLSFTTAAAEIHGDRLVAPTNKGLFIVNHKLLQESNYLPRIVISSIETNEGIIFNSARPLSGPLEVGNIRFKFAAMDFTTLGGKSYLYRLKNYDDTWLPTQSNYVSYGNLPPGDYVFEVMGSNADGVWNSNVETYQFSVARPLSDYVTLLLVLLFLMMIFLYFLQRRRQVLDLHSQVRVDSLTNLPNRIAFNEQLQSSMSIQNSVFALAVIDFDRFKDINDIHGHSIGDKFLKEVGRRLRKSTKGRDYVARLSGDEFVLIVYHFINEENLINLLNRIMDKLSANYHLDEINIKSSASIGVAIFPRDGLSQEELFSHADTAMYQAKKMGKNQLYFFNDDLRKQLQRRISIKANLEQALLNKEFELYYQPKIHPNTMTIVGAEALIRWNNPQEGLIPPYQFIEEAENNGFITELGAWVIEQACIDYPVLKAQIPTLSSVSVNVSPKQLVKGDFLSVVEHALHKTGMEPDCLELEITEYSLMDESSQTFELIDRLKATGVTIALDDFGTGYSSLSYLAKYPIDTLKIDRSIISGASEGSSSLKVLHNIFLLAHSLDMQVVTEGIETLEQLKLVDNYADDLIQGYYFSQPLSIEAFIQFALDFKRRHF